MPWWRVDDGFGEHPKVELLEGDPTEHAFAIAAWTLCGVLCARRLTDGVVTRSAMAKALPRWPEKRREAAAAALVRVGLWVELVEGGWRFHDWLDRNPSREDVLADRAAAADRKARSRAASRRGHAVTPGVTPGGTPPHAARPPDPDPDPDPEESESALAPGVVELERAVRFRAEVRGYLIRAYQARYERETREAWMGLPRAGQHVDEVLAWVMAQAEPIDACDRLMDAVFETGRFRARRWPWAWIAEDPGAIAASSTAPSATRGLAPFEVEVVDADAE